MVPPSEIDIHVLNEERQILYVLAAHEAKHLTPHQIAAFLRDDYTISLTPHVAKTHLQRLAQNRAVNGRVVKGKTGRKPYGYRIMQKGQDILQDKQDIIITAEAPYDGRRRFKNRISNLTGEIIVHDPYLDESIFGWLTGLRSTSTKNIRLLAGGERNRDPFFCDQAKAFAQEHNINIEIRQKKRETKGKIHLRFILGENEGYSSDASFKDLGKKDSEINLQDKSNTKKWKQQFEKQWATARRIFPPQN